jgi:hypothetical protein
MSLRQVASSRTCSPPCKSETKPRGNVRSSRTVSAEGIWYLDLIAHVHPDGEGSNDEDENQTGIKVSNHALGISILEFSNVKVLERKEVNHKNTSLRSWAGLIILPLIGRG